MTYLTKYFYKIIKELFQQYSETYDINEDRIIVWSDKEGGLVYVYYEEFNYVEDIIRKIEELTKYDI